MYDLKHCQHEERETWWEYDAQGIPLCKVCDLCVTAKLSTYRPEILSGYTQADVDESIEPDDGLSIGMASNELSAPHPCDPFYQEWEEYE